MTERRIPDGGVDMSVIYCEFCFGEHESDDAYLCSERENDSNEMVAKIRYGDINEIANTCAYNNNYPEWTVMLTDLINGDLSLDVLRKDVVEAYYNGGFCFLAYESLRDDKGVFIKEVPNEPYPSRYLKQKP